MSFLTLKATNKQCKLERNFKEFEYYKACFFSKSLMLKSHFTCSCSINIFIKLLVFNAISVTKTKFIVSNVFKYESTMKIFKFRHSAMYVAAVLDLKDKSILQYPWQHKSRAIVRLV